jgi:hypothetical protein
LILTRPLPVQKGPLHRGGRAAHPEPRCRRPLQPEACRVAQARSCTIGFSGAVNGLSDHFAAGSSQLMHWRTVRPQMVTTGTIRFSQFGQRVVRSMRSSRFSALNQEPGLLFHLSVTAKPGGCHGSCSGHARSARAAAGPSIPDIGSTPATFQSIRAATTSSPASRNGSGYCGSIVILMTLVTA